MPTLKPRELESLRRFGNKLYDFLCGDLELDEQTADDIAARVLSFIRQQAEHTADRSENP